MTDKIPGRGRPLFHFQDMIDLCERFYERDGFVKWTAVAQALGVSRQAVQRRLITAVERGDIPQSTVDRYQSVASRAATSRERERQRKETYKLHTFPITLTEENAAWVRKEAAYQGVRKTEFINGLITKARTDAAPPPSP